MAYRHVFDVACFTGHRPFTGKITYTQEKFLSRNPKRRPVHVPIFGMMR